jgi:tetratricopeptide (TPR) repeat protein
MECRAMQNQISDGEKAYLLYLNLEEQGRHLEAEKALTEAIKFKEPMAMHALAYELYDKEGQRDLAISLYIKASELGFTGSMFNLALHYKSMDDLKSYNFWKQRIAQFGDDQSINELSDIEEQDMS